jgi:hypothetical protein
MVAVLGRIPMLALAVLAGAATVIGFYDIGVYVSVMLERLNGTSDAYLGLAWLGFLPAGGCLGGYVSGTLSDLGKPSRWRPLKWLLVTPGAYVVLIAGLTQAPNTPPAAPEIALNPLFGSVLVIASYCGTAAGNLFRRSEA